MSEIKRLGDKNKELLKDLINNPESMGDYGYNSSIKKNMIQEKNIMMKMPNGFEKDIDFNITSFSSTQSGYSAIRGMSSLNLKHNFNTDIITNFIFANKNSDILFSFGSIKLKSEFSNIRIKKINNTIEPISSSVVDSFHDIYDFNTESDNSKNPIERLCNLIRNTSSLYNKLQNAEKYSSKIENHRKLMQPFHIYYKSKKRYITFN